MKKLFLISLLFIIPQFALGATLSLSPKTVSVNAEKTFVLNVLVNSTDQAINAVSANITFPSNLLRVSKIDTGGSVIKFWATEPSYSNSAGTVNLEGVIFNPGYQGTGGRVTSITFKPVKTGSAQISFVSGSVLANDGLGTEVLTGTAPAQVKIEAAAEPAVPEVPNVIVPIPVIISSTHPIQGEKYGGKEAAFSWELPAGIDAVRLSYGHEPSDAPAVLYAPPISGKTIIVQNDGTYYFNAQFRKEGVWGDAAHYKFMISGDAMPVEPAATSSTGTTSLQQVPPVDTEVTMTLTDYADPAELAFAVNIIVVLLLVIFFLVLKIRKNKKLNKEIILPAVIKKDKDTSKIVEHAFDVLSWDVKRQLNLLSGVKKERDLTQTEKIIDKNLQESLRLAEEHIQKELKPRNKKIIHRKKAKK